MFLKRSVALAVSFTLLLASTGCSYNPFATNNHLTGNPAGAAAGGIIGGGGAALLGASKSVILGTGILGAAIGYYVTTLNFDAGGVRQVGGQVYTLGDYVTIEIPTDQIFDDNSSELLPEAYPVLQSAVEVLERFPDSNIMVSGNTSGFGTRRFELKLSEARAQKVAAFLWANGVKSFKSTDTMLLQHRKLIYVGYGDYFPIANNIRASGIRANSRIQITAFPSKDDLHLSKCEKVFANIGESNDAPIDNQPNVSEAFKGDLLPNTESAKPGDSFSEVAPYTADAPPKERGYFPESGALRNDGNTEKNYRSGSSTVQTYDGGSVVKQGGRTVYKD